MTSTRPVLSSTTPSEPILSRDGKMSHAWLKWFQNNGAAINAAFDQQGALQGIIGASATVSGRPSDPLAMLVQNLNGGGQIEPGGLPTPTATTLGGVKSAGPTASRWITEIDTAGLPHLGQPAFTDVSGSATAAQVPALSALTGSVTSGQVPALSALSGSVTAGQVPALSALSGNITASQGPTAAFSGTITTAKLTTATGSMTFVNGILTAQTPAT